MSYSAICDYGVRHPVINGKYSCKCGINFGFGVFALQDYCKEKYKISYSRDITSEMRREFYLFNKSLGNIETEN